MYVCICNNVTESDIDRAISDGAISLGCVKEKLGVASCCGQCEDRASEYVDTALPKQASKANPEGTARHQQRRLPSG